MSPKEKAAELVNKMLPHVNGADRYNLNLESHLLFAAKQCALIAVQEIIAAIDWHRYETPNAELNFWLSVKSEINAL